MENVLSVSSLTKYYGNLKALDSLSFEVKRGQVYGILGPNGSGKTTTLGLITGILKSNGGEFSWFGKKISPETKKKVGTILETPNFYPYLSGRRNLLINSLIKNAPKENIQKSLEFVNLTERPKQKFKNYSLGMKQRLAIANAIINDPEVLILDEPTNGLDPVGIKEVRDMIKDLANQGKTIILASHLLDEVQKVCTHTLILKKGKTLYDGPIQSGDSNEFIISAKDKERLIEEINLSDNIKLIRSEDEGNVLVESEVLSAEAINKYFAEKGIYLNHLNMKKVGLEKIFMDITGLEKK